MPIPTGGDTTKEASKSKSILKKIDSPKIKKGKENVKNPKIKESTLQEKVDAMNEIVYDFEEEVIHDNPIDEIKTTTQTKKVGFYKTVAFTFLILTLLLLVAVFYFFFVKVKITIVPNEETFTGTLTESIYDTTKYADSEEGSGHIGGAVKRITVEEEKTYSASGKKVIGDEIIGIVSIINNYNKNQPLVASTRILSPDGKLYRIKNTVNVPANQSVDVEIYTDDPSEELAIGPTRFNIPGLWSGLQDKIYAINKASFEYKEKANYYIGQNDIANAKDDMRNSLIAKIKNDITAMYENYDDVVYKIDDNSFKDSVEAKTGEAKSSFSVKMEAQADVVSFNKKDVVALVKLKSQSLVPENKKLLDIDESKINSELIDFDMDNNKAGVNITYSGSMMEDYSSLNIIEKDKILGLNLDQLKNYLNSLPLVKSYTIELTPSFIKRVPNLIDRIEVEVQQ